MEKFIKGTGIVCEYNPFHKGHAYQISKVREMGASFVVCAMSGEFTQRAEPSFQDKCVRAENAVKNGADIVLEIPFPFSSMSAEGFARAGISILENSGLCDSFAFGSECADIEKLGCVAEMSDDAFRKEVVELQKTMPNLSYASAREKLVREKLGEDYASLLKNPNDILGIEYLRANKSLCPVAVQRKTPRGGFDDDFASSSYIRGNLFLDGRMTDAKEYLPCGYCFDGINDNNKLFYSHMLLSLVQKTPEYLSDIAEVPKGCEYSIIKCASDAESYEELCSLLASKTLTDAKIRRMLLFAFFGVTKNMCGCVPEYARILACSELGRKKLKEYAQDRKIIVASRVADIKKNEKALCQYNFARRAAEVLEKCRKMNF